MSDDLTDEQIERGKKLGNLAAAMVFWLVVAPIVYYVGCNIVVLPLLFLLEGADVGAEPRGALEVFLNILGVLVGVGAVWLAWRRARKAYANHAAQQASEPDAAFAGIRSTIRACPGGTGRVPRAVWL